MAAIQISNTGGQRLVGVAYADLSLKTIGTLQMPDNEQLSNIEVFFLFIFIIILTLLSSSSYSFRAFSTKSAPRKSSASPTTARTRT